MKNSEFRTPLYQSGAIIAAIVIIISMLPSSEPANAASAGGGFFSGIGHAILFVIGICLALLIMLAVVAGVFLCGAALISPEKSSDMYSFLKVKIAQLIQDTMGQCSCGEKAVPAAPAVTESHLEQVKKETASLQSENVKLLKDVAALKSRNERLQQDVEELTGKIDELKEAKQKIHDVLSDLSAQVAQEPDAELKDQISTLEALYNKTKDSLTDLSNRLEAVEQEVTRPTPSGGIFSYIEAEEDKLLVAKQVELAISRDMTYAQIDDFLSETLPEKLDTVMKDHPSLTKDYIRSLRQ